MGISFKNWCVANVAVFILVFGALIGVMLGVAPDASEILSEDAGIIAFLVLLAASLVFAAVIATYAYRNFDDVVSR